MHVEVNMYGRMTCSLISILEGNVLYKVEQLELHMILERTKGGRKREKE